MKRALVFFLLGLLVGEFDPIGWAAWQVLERQLPRAKQESLAAPSPFDYAANSRVLIVADVKRGEWAGTTS